MTVTDDWYERRATASTATRSSHSTASDRISKLSLARRDACWGAADDPDQLGWPYRGLLLPDGAVRMEVSAVLWATLALAAGAICVLLYAM
jgi:hypothetical protein